MAMAVGPRSSTYSTLRSRREVFSSPRPATDGTGTTACGLPMSTEVAGRAVDVDRLADDGRAHVDADRAAVCRDVDLLDAAARREAQVPGLGEALATRNRA
jgi:hypothetical protein